MLLAINVDNTNIKFAVLDGDTIVGAVAPAHQAMRTADEYAVWLTQLMAHARARPASRSPARSSASVVPQANFNLRRLCERYFRLRAADRRRADVDLGIEVLIERPQEAGADRICNAVGATSMFTAAPLIVVDFGTATTFDVVDEERQLSAAACIAPGINCRIEALYIGGRPAAAHRGRAPGEGDRHDDRRLHAVRRLLGLCRPDRGPGRAHQGRVRQADEGGRDRRPRLAVRRMRLR